MCPSFLVPYVSCLTVSLEWALPDQLVFATVSALLRIAGNHSEYREVATGAIVQFVERIVSMLKSGHCESLNGDIRDCVHRFHLASDILAQFAPSFHGFYRAITSIPFPWSLPEWTSLATHLKDLFEESLVQRLNSFLGALSVEDNDLDKLHFIHTLLARYVSRGRPLSGYFIVCCVIEAQWTTLAQALAPSQSSTGSRYPEFQEAAAANRAWQSLLDVAVVDPSNVDETFKDILEITLQNVTRLFTDLIVGIEEMDAVPSEDSYVWETMSESLVSPLNLPTFKTTIHHK